MDDDEEDDSPGARARWSRLVLCVRACALVCVVRVCMHFGACARHCVVAAPRHAFICVFCGIAGSDSDPSGDNMDAKEIARSRVFRNLMDDTTATRSKRREKVQASKAAGSIPKPARAPGRAGGSRSGVGRAGTEDASPVARRVSSIYSVSGAAGGSGAVAIEKFDRGSVSAFADNLRSWEPSRRSRQSTSLSAGASSPGARSAPHASRRTGGVGGGGGGPQSADRAFVESAKAAAEPSAA